MNVHPIVLVTRTALDVLDSAVDDGDRTPDRIDAVLERAGDGVRVGLQLPRNLRGWIERLSRDELSGSLTRAADRLASVPLPKDQEDLDALVPCVRERDRAESVLVGIQRACLGSDRFLSDIGSAEATLDLLAEVDGELSVRVGRAAVERALGLRVGLLGEHGWTHDMSYGPDTLPGRDELDVRWCEGSVLVRPSDSVVATYVELGRHAATVEGFAAHDATFAETLAATISAFRMTSERISLLARRWERGRKAAFQERAPSDGDVIPLELPLVHAAASEAVAESRRSLGILEPTDAEADLILAEGRAKLCVASGKVPIVRISFGDGTTTQETRLGIWELEIQATSNPVTLDVECADGRRFTAKLGLFDSAEPA